MYKNKNIHLVIAISIIITMILHMVIPHSHHHHEDLDVVAHSHTHQTHNDGHRHAHSHDHDTEKTNSQEAFSFPTNKHLHAFHIHEFVHGSKNRPLQLLEKTLPFQADLNATNSYYHDKNKQSYSFVLFRRIIYDNPFTEHCQLRAPPETI